MTTATITGDTTAADNGTGQAGIANHYQLPGVSWLSVDLNPGVAQGVDGTLTVGSIAVPVQLTPPANGAPARIDVAPTGLTQSEISAAAVSAGGTDPLAELPSSLAAFVGGITVAHIGVAIDLTAAALAGIEVTVAADQPWWVLPGHFEVDDLHLTVAYTRAGDSHTVQVTGGGTVLGSVVELTALRGDDGSFTITVHGLDGVGIEVPGIAEVAGLLGGTDLAGALPPGLSDLPGFVLSDAVVVLTTDGVESARVSIAGGSAWTLPDPIGLTIDEPTLSVAVEHPADPSTRTVEVSVEGAATFAEAAITVSYDQGLRVAGTINVAGWSAWAKMEIDPTQGIEAAGSLSPVHIGDVFSLTADGSDAGPSLDIQVKATAVPTIAITGQASLLGLTAAAHVTLSDQGFDFCCAGRVFGAFDAAVTAKGSSLQSADGFSVHAQMSQNFLSDLTSRAAGILQQAAAQGAAQIAAAQRDVTNAQADVDRLNTLAAAARADLANKQADAQRQIANARAQVTGAQNSPSAIDAQIASTRAGIQAERDAAAKKIQDAQAAVTAAQGPVNDLNSQISSLQGQINQLNSDITWWNNWYNNSAWYEKAYRWAQLSAEVGWRGTKVAALTVALGTLQGSVATANGVLQVAVQTLHAAQATAVTYPIDQDPRIVALQTGRSAAGLGLQAAQGVLSATQQTTAAAITAAGQTVATLAQQAGAANTVLQTTSSALGLLRQGMGEVAGMAGFIAQHGLGALLDVRSASFDGSISAAHGGAVTLDAVVVFQGVQQTVHVSFDFNDLVAGAKALAKAVVPSLPA